MNLVFQALVIFTFVLPGLLFTSAYNKGAWNYPYGRFGPFSEQVPRSIGHAVWLNFVWAWLVSSSHLLVPAIVWSIDFKSVVYWLSNTFGNNNAAFDRAVGALTASPTRLFGYFYGLFLFSWLFGRVLHVLVRSQKWDRKFRTLRYDNDWHYLFKWEVQDFPDQAYNIRLGNLQAAGRREQTVATIVAVIVDVRDKSFLYIGVLVDFFFDANGNLERLLLEGVKRREISEDDPDGTGRSSFFDQGRFYAVKGHYFIVRMSEIKTMNIDYITISDLSQVDEWVEQEVSNKDDKEPFGQATAAAMTQGIEQNPVA